MADVKLLEELHANTRRTRITYRATAAGQQLALKCYRRPLWGLVHWLRAQRRGIKIRRAGAPVPEIVFSGWLPQRRCFAYGTAFLEGYQPLRKVLLATVNLDRQAQLIAGLGRMVADLHARGILQGDGNLTNFLLGEHDQLMVVDEDDIAVFSGLLPLKHAVSNLANIAARLPDKQAAAVLLQAYLGTCSAARQQDWQDAAFWQAVEGWRTNFENKRADRNIEARRRFD